MLLKGKSAIIYGGGGAVGSAVAAAFAREGAHHRWVVERTLSWLNRYRRLKVRYERRADIYQAFLTIGCALITWNCVQRFSEGHVG